MTEKYQNKFRIPSARARWWNYGWEGAYFITICTASHQHYFGEIRKGKMHLSHTGVLADVFWYEIIHHVQNVELGAFVVMPNHIHGILILDNPGTPTLPVETLHATSIPEQALHAPALYVETLHATSLRSSSSSPPTAKNEKMAQISPKSHTVSSVMRSYKSAVTKHANRLGFVFGWQTRFYDHIIRNDAEYQRINDYIESNPSKWENDKFFKNDEQP